MVMMIQRKKPSDWNEMTEEEKIGYRSAIDDIMGSLWSLRKELDDINTGIPGKGGE